MSRKAHQYWMTVPWRDKGKRCMSSPRSWPFTATAAYPLWVYSAEWHLPANTPVSLLFYNWTHILFSKMSFTLCLLDSRHTLPETKSGQTPACFSHDIVWEIKGGRSSFSVEPTARVTVSNVHSYGSGAARTVTDSQGIDADITHTTWLSCTDTAFCNTE